MISIFLEKLAENIHRGCLLKLEKRLDVEWLDSWGLLTNGRRINILCLYGCIAYK